MRMFKKLKENLFPKDKGRVLEQGQPGSSVKVSAAPPDADATNPEWDDPFNHLRKKWSELPAGMDRMSSVDIGKMPDEELLKWWRGTVQHATTGPFYGVRGWYHTLYEPLIKKSRVIEIGTGFGIDGLTFAHWASHYTFVDLSRDNLRLLQRLAGLLGLKNVTFVWLENFDSLNGLPYDQDIILASGSLHHAPSRVIKKEIDQLAKRLKIGGRWLQLAYPKARWMKEGQKPFSIWGKNTDGEATPWAEWYDLPKLLELFPPCEFEAIMAFDYHNDDFNWFDLVRRK
ncbi:MAG: class I SAM-dependent methyltransferase [Planctomycetota bacterium]|nr:class I SAM-dependent methyltransferase [Planctomycetota bacterium]